MLGSPRGTVRRHEPITQAVNRIGDDPFLHVDPGASPSWPTRIADNGFRRPLLRRLVVKEVTPLLGEWLVDRFRPVVVDLDRHPVAIAESHLRLGWAPSHRERDRVPGMAGERLQAMWSTLDDIGRKVAYVGAVREHVRTTDWWATAVRVRYEDLLANPEAMFATLADRLSLGRPTLDVVDEGPSTGPYALTRPAVTYPPAGATGSARSVWGRFDTGAYSDDVDWLD